MSTKYLKVGAELENFDFARRPIKSNDRVSGSTPYLGASGVVDFVEGFTHEGTYLCVSEDGENLRSRNTPIAWVQKGRFWANNHLHILGSVSENRLRFYAAALNNCDIGSYITGSAQPKLSQSSLSDILIPFFNANQQESIGALLGVLDEKIAANASVISSTTALQSALWHQATIDVIKKPLGYFVESHLGGTPKRSDDSAWVDEVSWASVKDMSAAGQGIIVETTEGISTAASESARRLNPLPSGSVFLSARGTVGVVTTNAMPCAINQSAYAFVPPEGKGPSLRLAIESLVDRLRARAHGSTFSTITKQDLRESSIPDLDSPEVESLSPTLADLENLRIAKAEESHALSATRDELLPLLMSGRITVADAEKRITE